MDCTLGSFQSPREVTFSDCGVPVKNRYPRTPFIRTYFVWVARLFEIRGVPREVTAWITFGRAVIRPHPRWTACFGPCVSQIVESAIIRVAAPPSLQLHSFNDAGSEGIMQRRDAGNPEAGGAIQILPLLPRSFFPANGKKHENVQKLGRSRAGIAHRRNDGIDANQPSVALHAAMAVPKKAKAVLVVPVVNDVFEDVRVGARYRLEHLSAPTYSSREAM